jgi:hypothetical protein
MNSKGIREVEFWLEVDIFFKHKIDKSHFKDLEVNQKLTKKGGAFIHERALDNNIRQLTADSRSQKSSMKSITIEHSSQNE